MAESVPLLGRKSSEISEEGEVNDGLTIPTRSISPASFLAPPAVRIDLHSPGIAPHLAYASNIPSHSGSISSDSPTYSSQSSPSLHHSYDDHFSSQLRSEEQNHSSGAAIGDHNQRFWYDNFTTIDWVHDFIKESFRVKRLHDMPGIRGRFERTRDASQGWFLVSVIGACVAGIAYLIQGAEERIFDWRSGFCTTNLFAPQRICCMDKIDACPAWVEWRVGMLGSAFAEYGLYILLSIVLATVAVLLTLTTATTTPFVRNAKPETASANTSTAYTVVDGPIAVLPNSKFTRNEASTSVIYSAAGGGVAEVKTILSGFVIKKYLGSYTLFIKSIALVLSISSGLNVGKEGPYVHIAACVGNIACRFFSKFSDNDGKRREIISAAAAAGVAVSFGSPLGGVVFSLEEVSYYFPPKTLLRSFLCAVISALVLKFLNPYGTGKIVLFQVAYEHDWHTFEFLIFVFIGALGGLIGATVSRLNRWWVRVFSSKKFVKRHPVFEVIVLVVLTSAISYFNVYTKKPPSELVYDLARPCVYREDADDVLSLDYEDDAELCPTTMSAYAASILSLVIAFIVKLGLTSITIGLKVPAGIYVPSMVIGALFGRIVGLMIQLLQYQIPGLFLFSSCPAGADPRECTTPGVYALIGAGAVMAGVTRMTVTLVVILFELTGSLDHVLPISVAIIVSKWVAQALEPVSLFDSMINNNNFPFLDNQRTPGFSGTIHDIVPKAVISANSPVIDISDSAYISASLLRTKLKVVQNLGEFDGSLPILRNHVLMGLIPAPELDYALDKMKEMDAFAKNLPFRDLGELLDSDENLCHLSADDEEIWRFRHEQQQDAASGQSSRVTDFTPFVDRSPITLDVKSPLAMVYFFFVRLGLRMVCVVDDGKFWGVLHKKRFIEYCRFEEDARDR
ncbi:chloride channel [Limtongia smithiae]|uniref:chloride channel n=1 Tax=Limtongia smithiae TaxID=1125753 RepID=UPI0034D00171